MNWKKEYLKNAIILENKSKNLFVEIMAKISNHVKSVTIMSDDNFTHRKDRVENDIHLFLELHNGKYFHLRSYVRFMLTALEIVEQDKIFLTGYLKNSVTQNGGTHSFKQTWYNLNSENIFEEILNQNNKYFRLRNKDLS